MHTSADAVNDHCVYACVVGISLTIRAGSVCLVTMTASSIGKSFCQIKLVNYVVFSFNVGKAHIIMFSTEVYFFVEFGTAQIETQYHWLENELKVVTIVSDNTDPSLPVASCNT